MKQTWKILTTAMNKASIKPSLPEHFDVNDDKISDKQEIVDKFNTFFASIGSDISHGVPLTAKPYTDYLPHAHHRSMFLDPITPQDTIDITSKLKNKTSRGHDNISSKLAKQTINQIVVPLTHIINQSMTTGVVPEDMKIARVIPIFKSGNQNMFNNYRPISILPAFSKILEKTIATKLMKFLESQNLIYEHQYGFRPKHSTIHPIIHLLNQIVTENDKTTKNLTLSVFIDLSKAFDTISHEILLKVTSRIENNLWKSTILNHLLKH